MPIVSNLRIYRGYKTELEPTRAQERALRQHIDAARWAYNWGLSRKVECHQQSTPAPNWMGLSLELNRRKRAEFPWLYEVSKVAPLEAFKDLDRAFVAFFRRGRRRVGFPRFKRRRDDLGSCRFRGAIHVNQRNVQLPRVGRIRVKETGYLPTSSVKILSATVTYRAARWFVSVTVEQEIKVPSPRDPAVGVDVGLSTLATLSDGTMFEPSRALANDLARLARAHRALSRKRLGSANRAKARLRLARLHAKVANRRKDLIHKMTTSLAKTKSVIVIEDINVAGLMRNHSLAKRFIDSSLGEVRRQLSYKSQWYGSTLLVAPNFYPSTSRCSACGVKGPALSLSERDFRCANCGFAEDRDINAARNLLAFAARPAETTNACGGDVSPLVTRLSPLKQEPDGRPWTTNPETGQTSSIETGMGRLM